jgi:uncharacterized membrane protein YoaK (UPF0700 family)
MFVTAIVSLVAWVRRHAGRLDSPWTESLVVSSLGIVAALLAVGIARNILEEYPTGELIWLVVGLAIATTRTALERPVPERLETVTVAPEPSPRCEATGRGAEQAPPAAAGFATSEPRAGIGWR